ncbi:ArsR/SmtB family transcription factor [Spirosoma soli]|uniref:ArsR/SmtB family transcription factor n=1 Tax=Spirosoma soli TaxID=1770529 RepID=A0ABW5M0T7_9BACT
MGVTKTEVFTADQNRIAELAKAFAHPARVAILQHLIATKSCVCGELVDELPLSQATVSQHLKELSRIGLIKGNVQPPRVCYCIDEVAWKGAKARFGELLASFTGNECC